MIKTIHKQLLLGMTILTSLSGIAAPAAAKSSDPNKNLVLPAASVSVTGCRKMSEKAIRRLLPELKRENVRVGRLSKQIQLVNDGKTVKLLVDFQPDGNGKYNVIIKAQEEAWQSVNISVSNTGSAYTGDWRVSTGFYDTNISGNADSLGLTYITSPGHTQDVKQEAFFYKTIFPHTSDSAYITFSNSDVDMGTLGNFGGITMGATGRGKTFGIHYMHNDKYKIRHKKIWDLGYDYRKYDNAHFYNIGGGLYFNDGQKFDVSTISLTYSDITRWNNQIAYYSLGYEHNINGDAKAYNNYHTGSNENFDLWKFNFGFQHLFKHDWMLSYRFNAQYSKHDLLPTEQLGAGGEGSVRGLQDRSTSADKGFVTNLELYTPQFCHNSRFLVFFDGARLFNNHKNFGEYSVDNVSSVGIGYRFNDEKSGFSILLDYAKVVDRIKNQIDRSSERHWHLVVSKSF